MSYCRINLAKTSYIEMPKSNAVLISEPVTLISNFQQIYKSYCRYKKFSSVMPIFDSEFTDDKNDVIGYYDNNNLIAFSLLRKFDKQNIEAVQFAWDYSNPKLQLGIQSLKHECSFYKNLGYNYLYLGNADEYKNNIDGFEILGPL